MDADVIVVGGGPGGTTAATMLARQGWRVILFERERFPREHIGESLLPASIPILEELGVLPAVREAGFLPKWGATMVWGTSSEPWSWYFRETNQRNPHSYQVWRPQFDQLLLENSRANAVDAREGHRVISVERGPDGLSSVRYLVEAEAGERTAQARFVVDASGQTGLLGRSLGLRRADDQFRNLAVYGYFSGAEPLPAPDETNIFIESYANGWVWMIPLHTGQMSVGAVVDGRYGQRTIARRGLEAMYAGELALAANAQRMLRSARLESGPVVIRDWSYTSTTVAGDGFVLVGDAACFIDPLFSTGVHLALMAGVVGAAYVTTALRHPEMREAAGKAYQELYYQQYGHFRELARLFYASNRSVESYFWEARRILGSDGVMSPRLAFIRAAAGQPPKGYERMVLEHGEPPREIADDILAVESDRARRRERVATASRKRLLSSVPRLKEGAKVERKPVLGEGEFVWGPVLSVPGQLDDTPLSPLVARLLQMLGERTTVSHLLEEICRGLDKGSSSRAAEAAISALQVLYVDGAIDALEGL